METGAAVEAVEQGTGGAPEAQPSAPPSSGTPASAPAPAPGGEATEAAPSAAPTQQPAQPAVKEPPPPGWADFRRVKSQLERAQRQLEERQQAQQQWEQEKAAWQQERQSLAQRAADYDALAKRVEEDPQFAAEMERVLRTGTGTARATAAVATLPPDVLKRLDKLDELHGAWQNERQAREQAQRDQILAQTDSELRQTIGSLLKERQYSERFLPYVRAYVITRAQEEEARGGRLSMEEVPYIFSEWFQAQENAFQERLGRFSTGAQQRIQQVPASPGAGGAALIAGKPETDAFGPLTKGALADDLKKLGWGKQG